MVRIDVDRSEPLDRFGQTLAQGCRWVPSELRSRKCDVRLASRGVIGGQWQITELHLALSQFANQLGQFANGVFVGISDIDRSGKSLCIHHANHRVDQIVPVTE